MSGRAGGRDVVLRCVALRIAVRCTAWRGVALGCVASRPLSNRVPVDLELGGLLVFDFFGFGVGILIFLFLLILRDLDLGHKVK